MPRLSTLRENGLGVVLWVTAQIRPPRNKYRAARALVMGHDTSQTLTKGNDMDAATTTPLASRELLSGQAGDYTDARRSAASAVSLSLILQILGVGPGLSDFGCR